MTNQNSQPAPDLSRIIDPNLYPDLMSLGGLAQAIRRTAEHLRIELGTITTQPGAGEFITAEIGSARGTISVLLGVERRLFSVKISAETHVWATGGIDDLDSVLGVADAWRKGASLQELTDHFPFMHETALARAYENGDPIVAQWDLLLSHSEYVELRPLLRAVHALDEFRSLFPYISHNVLRLAHSPSRSRVSSP
ncbi:hypothetical protein [Actinoallomurus rhizosphaericola]|uniref:hypothetical protein n=1 Tax=Actinoallomurus rhizosphaericola TaxID=2952536 RepID=UPI002090CD99|nr:hypothetical protein [Actinoallomurus rhizosphaericola]MCO5993663.1 hypothetical protein [Actinoallomurus rhizosphaericola]